VIRFHNPSFSIKTDKVSNGSVELYCCSKEKEAGPPDLKTQTQENVNFKKLTFFVEVFLEN